jgi:signal transduction histidine kinase
MNHLSMANTGTRVHDLWRGRGGNQAWMTAVLSHELTTPLNALLGSISLLERENAVSSQFLRVDRTQIDRMQRNGRHLRTMLDGLLKLLRAEAGDFEMPFAEGSLHTAVAEALSDVEMEACAKGVTIANTIADSTDALSFWGDETCVRQILVNLLANAIKFTNESGRITISVGQDLRASADATDVVASHVYVQVQDTGRGIPPHRLDDIFEPFQQAEAADCRCGTGLGLAISRRFAHAMGGEIEATSEVGVGSIFTLCLPQHARPCCDPID